MVQRVEAALMQSLLLIMLYVVGNDADIVMEIPVLMMLVLVPAVKVVRVMMVVVVVVMCRRRQS